MLKNIKKSNEAVYACNECALQYRDIKTAQQCEAWCAENNSCNLDIISHAIKDVPKTKMNSKDVLRVVGIPVIVASLCCVTPIIIVLFGLGSVALAGSLADSLYGDYKWLFRIAGLSLLGLSVLSYLRRQKGICTFDEAKKRRNEIINIVVVALTIGVVGYVVWLYVIVEYIGMYLNIWS
jgi:hypothetical protein